MTSKVALAILVLVVLAGSAQVRACPVPPVREYTVQVAQYEVGCEEYTSGTYVKFGPLGGTYVSTSPLGVLIRFVVGTAVTLLTIRFIWHRIRNRPRGVRRGFAVDPLVH
jgi:hypothetical protein